jgi:hypothetical protein
VSATVKFYLGFALALLIVIGLSFYAGYATASHHAQRTALHSTA